MAREVSNNEEKADKPTKQEVLLEVYGKATNKYHFQIILKLLVMMRFIIT